jgi:hypothetical protein
MPAECTACGGRNVTETWHVERDDRLRLGNWACWSCGYAWESLNGWPCRDDQVQAIHYRRTDRYARLMKAAEARHA